MASASPTAAALRPARAVPASLGAAAAVTLALAASYAPNLAWLAQTWWAEPNYSHGFLVAPIAAAILWQRRDALRGLAIRPHAAGWVLLAALLALRVYLYERNEIWLETATLPVAAAALVLSFGGPRLLLWALPGLLFLPFMLPLPVSVNLMLSGPLQALATVASATLLTATGLPVITQGNVIHLGAQPLEVARACNGLSILMSFVTLVTATVIFARDHPTWQRLLLLLSTVPIALVANVLRITGTAWCYHLFGAKFGDKIAHDTAGWLMMPIALILIWAELKVFTWLVVEERVDLKASVRMSFETAGPRMVKK